MIKHFSATVYVVNKIGGEAKVLLHMHKKHHHWYGLGGHVEENENPVEAARREVMEEAGIDVTIFSKTNLLQTKFATEITPPVLLFEQDIDGDHRHIDCIYFGTTSDPSKVSMKEEYKWFSLAELDGVEIMPDTRYIAKEAITYFKTI